MKNFHLKTGSQPTLVISILFLSLICCQSAHARSVRQAAWAGKFYPAAAAELSSSIKKLSNQALKTNIEIPAGKEVKALILPHAGYIYSGLTAAHAVHVLQPDRFQKVVLIGPDHRVGFMYGAVSDSGFFQTPLATTALHRDADVLRSGKYFQANKASDRSEHSLEVVLPFLQSYLHSFELVPIVVGMGATTEITKAIDSILDANTILVVSSDLSHYLPYDQAVKKDSKTIQMIVELETEKLLMDQDRACGIRPISIAIEIAKARNWQPVLLHYSNSGDTAGTKDQVVGYASIVFYGEKEMTNSGAPKKVSQEQGQVLCDLARNTILQRFDRGMSDSDLAAMNKALQDEVFEQNGGVFVTLHLNGQLRGCIGSLVSSEPIKKGVQRNAENAAFSDYRFKPLTEGEADKVDLEVSILTEPQDLTYTDGADLVSKLRPRVDGVILSKGTARSTFLPQVWDQLPNPQDFLSHLCRKAGLDADAWNHGGVKIQTYQVQSFEEEK